MGKRMFLAVVLALSLSGCASVRVNSDGQSESRWETGLAGTFAKDIHMHNKDGSCVTVTWNKGIQWLFPYVATEVTYQEQCRHRD